MDRVQEEVSYENLYAWGRCPLVRNGGSRRGRQKPFGRLASRVAHILRGKHKPEFTPHADKGDYVIVVNADKLVFTGNKIDQKVYYRTAGHPGGLKESTYRTLDGNPSRIRSWSMLQRVCRRKLLGRQMIKKAGRSMRARIITMKPSSLKRWKCRRHNRWQQKAQYLGNRQMERKRRACTLGAGQRCFHCKQTRSGRIFCRKSLKMAPKKRRWW